jgi:transposase
MQSREVFERLLGLTRPWEVRDVDLALTENRVRVFVDLGDDAVLVCPECGKPCPGYDRRQRQWRHLDTMQYETLVIAEVPRLKCPEHGVRQISVPWAEDNSRFTALFEALVINWLKEASFAAVARQLGLSWDQVAGIQDRAVRRGLVRRELTPPRFIGVDETSFQKRHEYVTSVVDVEEGVVLHVADGRTQGALDGFYELLGEEGCAAIEAVAMDMWPAYINSTTAHVPEADEKIVFDKFHIAKHLGDAVDQVRRQEHRQLMAQGDGRLKKSKHLWLSRLSNLSRSQRSVFAALRTSELKVARAWALKELAMTLWGYTRRGWAERMWRRWYSWAIRCRLEPVKKVARMIKRHWDGVINAATSNVTNALSEGMNSKIQWIKRKACGYRNRERFRNAIYFHLGGLDLYPAAVQSTHRNS